jgi:hypothetical protein
MGVHSLTICDELITNSSSGKNNLRDDLGDSPIPTILISDDADAFVFLEDNTSEGCILK